MTWLKRITALVSAFLILISCSAVGFAQETAENAPTAEFVVANNSFATNNLDVYLVSGTMNFKEAAGKEGILVKNGTCGGVRIDIDNHVARAVKDGTSFDIEIDVYANAGTVFNGTYDAVGSSSKGLMSNYFIGHTGNWETVRLTLDDAYFDNRRSSNTDLEISGIIDYDYLLGGVRIYMHPQKNKVIVKSISSDNVGHIFASDEEQTFDVTLYNSTNQRRNATLVMSAETLDGEEVWRGKEIPVTADARTDTTYTVKIENEWFGRLRLFAEVKGEGFSHRNYTPYTYVNIIEDGTTNDKFGWNVAAGWGEERGYISENIAEMVARSNAGYVRHSVAWHQVETEKGKYSFPDFYIEISEFLAQNNIGALVNFRGGSSFYEGGFGDNANYIPIGEEAVNAFGEHVRWTIRELKSMGVRIVGYALCNEPDLPQFNLNSASGADLAAVVDKVQEIIEQEDRGNVLYPLGFSGTSGDLAHKIYTDTITAQKNPTAGVDLHMYSWHKTPEVGIRSALQWYRDTYKEVVGGDVKILASELGYPLFPTYETSENTEVGRAKWNTRNYLTLMADGNIDRLTWYTLQDNGDELMMREQMFGAVKTGGLQYKGRNLLNEGKETYAAFTNMNKMVQNAECEKVVMEDNYSRHAYIFRRPKDNKTVMPVWTTSKQQPFEFSCKAESLDVYDMYGNKSVLYPENGVYYLTLTDAVTYLEGDFTDIEIKECPAELLTTDFTVAANDTFIIPLTVVDSEECKGCKAIIVEDSDVLEPVKAEINLEEESRFIVKVSEKGIANPVTAEIKIIDEKGNLKYSENIKINGTDSLTFRAATFPTDDINKWGIEVSLANNSVSLPLSGTVEIVSPPELAALYGEREIKTIPAGKTARIEFEEKQIPVFGFYPLEFKLKQDNGTEQNFNVNVDYSVAHYAEEKPKIDGYISEGEWDEKSALMCDKPQQVLMSNYGGWLGVNDTSAKTMIKYDDEYFYMAADVVDDTNVLNPMNNGDVWRYDSIQFGVNFDFVPGTGMDVTKFTEISFGDTGGGPYIYRGRAESSAIVAGTVENSEFKLRREGVHTYYEIAIPWSEITDKKIDTDTLEHFRFSMLINDNDGAGRKGWIEYGSGIGRVKDVSAFSYLKLVKN